MDYFNYDNFLYYLKNNKKINLVGDNSIQKKNIYKKIEEDFDNVYYFGTNSILTPGAFYEPVIRFLFSYFDIDYNLKKRIKLKKSLKKKFKNIKLKNIEISKIEEYLDLFLDITDKDLIKKENTHIQLYQELFFILKNVIDLILKQSKKSILILDCYQYFDKWSKKLFTNILSKYPKYNISLVIASMNPIKDLKFNKIYVLDKEKMCLKKTDLNIFLKYMLAIGDSISKSFLKIIYDNSDLKNKFEFQNGCYLLNNIDFIFENRNVYYLLNKRLRNKLIKLIDVNEYKAIQEDVLKILKKIKAKGIYDLALKAKIYIEMNKSDKKDEIEFLKNYIRILEKIKAYDGLIKYYKRLLEIEKDKNNADIIINKIIPLYRSLSKYKEGYEFLKTLDKKEFSKKDENIINYNLLYLLRNTGELNIIEEHKKIADTALNNEWYDLYSDVISEISFIYHLRSNAKKARYYLNKIEKIKDKISEKKLYMNYYNTDAIIKKKEGNDKEAIKSYKKALKIAKKYDELYEQIIISGNLCSLYYFEGNFKSALKILHKNIKLVEDENMLKAQIHLYINLCFIYLEIGELDKVNKYISESINLSKITGKDRYLFLSYLLIGKMYGMKGDYKNALIYLGSLQSLIKESTRLRLKATCWLELGKVYLLIKNNKSIALDYFTKGMELSEEIFNEDIYYYYRYVVRLYHKMGDFDKSRKILDKGLKRTKNFNKVAYYRLKMEETILFDQKEIRIEKLKKLVTNFDYSIDKGDCNYILYKDTKKIEYKNKAISCYKNLSGLDIEERIKQL